MEGENRLREEPADPHEFGQSTGIIAVGLVGACREHPMRVPCLQTDHWQTRDLHGAEQNTSCRSGLHPDPLRVGRLLAQAVDERLRLRQHAAFEANPAILLQNTNADLAERHIKPT